MRKKRSKYKSYNELEKLGFGSWLKSDGKDLGMGAFNAWSGGVSGGAAPTVFQDSDFSSQKNADLSNQITQLSKVGGAMANAAISQQGMSGNLGTGNPGGLNSPGVGVPPIQRCGGRLRKKATGGPLVDEKTITNPTMIDTSEMFYQRQPVKPTPINTLQSITSRNDINGTLRDITFSDSGTHNSNSLKGLNQQQYDTWLADPNNQQMLSQNPRYAHLVPKKAMGGTINYNGQLHEGPDGGVPVDSNGNVEVQNPVALVEKGEVSWKQGKNQPYIFSDTLELSKGNTFAKEAKRLQSRFKVNGLRKGDTLTQKAYDAAMGELSGQQEKVREFNGMNQPKSQMRRGGRLPKYGGNDPNNLNGQFLPEGDISFRDLYTAPTPEDTLINPTPYNSNYTASEMGISNPYKFDNNLKGVDQSIMDNPQRITPRLAAQVQSTKPYVPGIDLKQITSNTDPLYSGQDWTSAAGLIAPIAGNLYGLAQLNKNKNKGRISAGQPGQAASDISLETERAAAREQANLARANARRSLKGGASAQQYMANVGASEIGIQRALGQQTGESYQKEAMYNNEVAQQNAARMDAYRREQMRADMYNSQLDKMNDAQKQQYINNMLNATNQWGAEMRQSKQNADYMNMLNPNAELRVDKYGRKYKYTKSTQKGK